ncbi:MAG: hypothetical protein COV44_02940 [Deltaproteobacteria bacterium CG11_big_fil_rev_8_21_14_0_20_45_16]|nr:MAG: hypothetical protein COV44_02940 [Deltaproteobacteria bacterium CG11_big_fil_rev_8_21_14_0_20_45_16]
MKVLNKDLVLLLIGSASILAIFGLSNTLEIGLLQSGAIVLVFALLCVGMFVLFRPLVLEEELMNSDSPRLFLGETIEKNPFKKGKPFYLYLHKLRHILVTGVTGAGKSTFIRRFIREVRRNFISFLYIDFKGEAEDHSEIIKICEMTGTKQVPQVFDISDPKNCLTCNLLTLFPSIEETVGFVIDLFFEKDANPYYKAEAERFIRHSLELLDEAKTTRSFIQLQQILYSSKQREALLRRAKLTAYKEAPFLNYFTEEFDKLDSRSRSERFSGLASLLSSFTSEPLARIFNAEQSQLRLTEIFNENQSLIIRIPGEAYGELSKRIVRAFIKTLPVLISRRRSQTDRKDYFILMDEGCSYASEVLTDLTKKAASAQVKLLLTRMADADFLDISPAFLGKMLSSIGTHFCFHTTDPDTRETLARISMTTDDIKQTYRVKEGSQTGEASEREVQRFRNHPSEFGSLETGHCIVMDTRQNIFQKIKVYSPFIEEKKAA